MQMPSQEPSRKLHDKGKYLTLTVLLGFVALIFVTTMLKLAKVF